MYHKKQQQQQQQLPSLPSSSSSSSNTNRCKKPSKKPKTSFFSRICFLSNSDSHSKHSNTNKSSDSALLSNAAIGQADFTATGDETGSSRNKSRKHSSVKLRKDYTRDGNLVSGSKSDECSSDHKGHSRQKCEDGAITIVQDREEDNLILSSSASGTGVGTVAMAPVAMLKSPMSVNNVLICSRRVRQVINLIQSDGIRKEDLLKNLHNTVELMEAIVVEEELEHSDAEEIDSESVPTEIREWITSTFSTNVNRVSRENKPKFRAVANAIRAGIMVEKMFKRSNEIASMKIPLEISKFMKDNVDQWSFDVFKLDEISGGHALTYVGLDLMLRLNVFHKFKVRLGNLENLLAHLERGYSKYGNPYHNLVHGADVAQTCHYLITTYKLKDNWLTDLESFATIFAALIHDFEHTGTTNNFHINTNSELTLLYNDRGVLENHHVSSVFRIMQDPDSDVLRNLDKLDYREFRHLVIEMVLSTDMSTHFKQMKNMKSHIQLGESVDKGMALSMVLHCADISHPAKHWDLHHRWTMQLLEEFFRQGDKEAELEIPFSPLCDRNSILIPESQIGFSNFIVAPSFEILGSMIDFIIDHLRKQGMRLNIYFDERKKPEDLYNVITPNGGSNTDLKSTTDGSIITVTNAVPAQLDHLRKCKIHIVQHPWEPFIIINRSYWQKKLEQDKESKSAQINK